MAINNFRKHLQVMIDCMGNDYERHFKTDVILKKWLLKWLSEQNKSLLNQWKIIKEKNIICSWMRWEGIWELFILRIVLTINERGEYERKCLGWNEIPVKITASNPETANFTTDVINTYNELIHYLYFNLSEDVFLKKLMDGFYREIFIMDIINLKLHEWLESSEEIKIKYISVPEVKTILSSYHEFWLNALMVMVMFVITKSRNQRK